MTCLRFDTWNSGQSHLINQMNKVKKIIQKRRPHLLALQESNLWKYQDKEKVKIDGYRLFTSKMLENEERRCSRVVVYVKDNLRVKQLNSLESDENSAIWLEIIFGALYCEHSHIKVNKEDLTVYSTREMQERRWNNFLKKWEEALDMGREVIVAGDVNINLLEEKEMTKLHRSLY